MSSPDPNFKVTTDEAHGIIAIHVSGYFNDRIGEKLCELLQEPLDSGKINVVIDMAGINLINSIGIGKLLEAIISIDETYCGQTIISGMSPLITEALTVSGIMTIAQSAPTMQQAIELAKIKRS